MKVWVVGASGMLGADIILYLKKNNIYCVGTNSKDVNICDIEDLRCFLYDKNFSHIINCAAYTQVDAAENNKDLVFNINIDGVKNLSIISNEMKAKLIHFSSDYVFAGYSNKPYIETDVTEPLSVYGISKAKGEEMLFEYAKDFCLIRTSWLFGFLGNNFVFNILKKMQSQEELKIVSDQIGKPTFCFDLSNEILSFFDKKGVFHFANDTVVSWYEFTKMIYDIAKNHMVLKCKKIIPIKTKDFVSLATRPAYSVLSTEKTERALNKKMPSLEGSLKYYIENISI
jgi:dTDP-4-dehydrorhamnose reductase